MIATPGWFYAGWIICQLLVGICAGLGAAMYLFWRRWFMERLHDIENDVEDLYIAHGQVPPGVRRAREKLGLLPLHERIDPTDE